MTWLPGVRRNPASRSGGSFVGRVTIGVLHTTESSSFTPGTTYFGHESWPHFTFIPDDRLSYREAVWQHLPLDTAARALENRLGNAIETNREGVIQIEVVAYAGDPDWSRGDGQGVRNLRRLMGEIEERTEIPHRCGVEFRERAQYGLGNPGELTGTQWRRYEGWCGHQHVPENRHWDPGAIDIDNLMDQEEPVTVEEIERVARRTSTLLLERLADRTDKTAEPARLQMGKATLYRVRHDQHGVRHAHSETGLNLLTRIDRVGQLVRARTAEADETVAAIDAALDANED
jgi:hypothetical protein